MRAFATFCQFLCCYILLRKRSTKCMVIRKFPPSMQLGPYGGVPGTHCLFLNHEQLEQYEIWQHDFQENKMVVLWSVT